MYLFFHVLLNCRRPAGFWTVGYANKRFCDRLSDLEIEGSKIDARYDVIERERQTEKLKSRKANGQNCTEDLSVRRVLRRQIQV